MMDSEMDAELLESLLKWLATFQVNKQCYIPAILPRWALAMTLWSSVTMGWPWPR